MTKKRWRKVFFVFAFELGERISTFWIVFLEESDKMRG